MSGTDGAIINSARQAVARDQQDRGRVMHVSPGQRLPLLAYVGSWVRQTTLLFRSLQVPTARGHRDPVATALRRSGSRPRRYARDVPSHVLCQASRTGYRSADFTT
jgi:hypothetical protein